MPILNAIPLKQQFIKHIKGNFQTNQTNIENLPYLIFNDMINIKIFDPNLLNINKISCKNTDAVMYNIKYNTMKSFDSKNLLYIIFNNEDG